MRLKDKVAIITGAGQGIGRAIAERFADEGAAVIVAELDPARGQQVVDLVRSRGHRAHLCPCDVTREDQVQEMVEFARRELGRIDILVNNAICAVDMIHGESWTVIEVAVRGTWNCARAVLPTMVEQQSGAVVNLSSVNALMSFGPEHLYAAAKGALVSMTRTLAAEYGQHNIRVNTLCPGSTETEHWEPIKQANPEVVASISKLYPLGRIGQPLEIANAALFLASEEASFVTGSVLVVDGGITASQMGFRKT
jgi:NAD(P)-dependent dehydrogenase (short-subunit alcohol dehydrogenase family)